MNSEKHKFELVLWDLDGTLIDTLEDLAAAVNHALALRGLPLHAVDEYRKMVGHGVRNLVRQAVEAAVQKTPDQVGGDDGRAVRGDDGRAVGGDGAAEGQQLRASGLRMLKEIGFSGTVPKNNFIQLQDGQLMPEYIDAALEDFKEYYKAHIDVHTRPYPGMQELLTELQGEGVKMAVVSNKFQEGTEHLIREFFPDIEFVAILGNRPGYPLKPDPEIVREVLEKAAVEKESAILVGDSPTDMRTAANGGIEAVAVSWGYRTVEELARAGVAAEAAAGPNTEVGSARAQTGPVAKNRIVHSVEELRNVLRK
ncbi:MAG: HAD-IA family hydrolase [Bacteroidales bacterium]|nr:HAD-IA family hydrolase [Bacteroidales bacterium]